MPTIGILLIAAVSLLVGALFMISRWQKNAMVDPEDRSYQFNDNLVWMSRMVLDAAENGDPFRVYRSGHSRRELREYLKLMYVQIQAILPDGVEVVAGSVNYHIPNKPHNGFYDGWVSVHLRRQTVA